MANGASQSGRYSSKGCQVHNFPRNTMSDPVECRADFIDGIIPEDIREYWQLPIMDILSRMLRPALVPEDGAGYLVSDWSAIEGRVGPWLADSPSGEKKLDIYRRGDDPYVIAAQAIYGSEEIDGDRRQVGKVAELALGFGGGAGAFLGMGRNYGITMGKDQANHIKDKWRLANPWAVQMWAGCEAAAMAALQRPGQRYNVGRLSYFAAERVLVGEKTLFCELPCGRLLTYPDARIGMRPTPWGEMVPGISALRAAWTPKATEREWPRADLWGGLLVENAVQGTAASLLRDALRQCQEAGLPVVLHVHDEIVAEVPQDQINNWSSVLHTIMNVAPDWAPGLPLQAEVDHVERFGK